MSRTLLIAAALLGGGLGAAAQSSFLPDVATTKVKTLRLDAKGNVLRETAPAPAPPPLLEQPALQPVLPPPVKVKVYRVEPNGRMHAPGEAERWPNWLR